jgi:hypothetical protein
MVTGIIAVYVLLYSLQITQISTADSTSSALCHASFFIDIPRVYSAVSTPADDLYLYYLI